VPRTPIEVTEASFGCISDGTKVRKFFVKNLIGDLEASLAVANGDADPPYPPGTLLQLVPQEAMVKRELGFSPETNDWEFFFLSVSPQETTIVQRGKDDAENAFGANCFACHSLAVSNDFVCETSNGCDPLAIGDDLISSLQTGDPRCQ
jgi:mono/diheme cytochrome c family protein